MTAIVGLVHDDRVYIGGDSAGVSGWQLTVRADAKVFRNGPYVFGFTTSFRMGQLIRYGLVPPKPPAAGKNLDRFMATVFVDAVRDCLKKGGWAKKDADREEGGDFLAGVNGRLFTVYSDYQVAEAADGYAAVGSGRELAVGALFATPGQKPRKRVALALTCAERHCAGVRGPFVTVSTR